MMIKHQTILERTTRFGFGVQFCNYDEDTNKRKESYFVPWDLYKDMGSPKLLTVTIEIGDKLND